MDADALATLLTAPGAAAVQAATTALDAGGDPLRVATEVRRRFPDLPASAAAAAITQAQLRRRARRRFGPDADRMWFTPDGVEQATRAEVADHRARRFARLAAALGRAPRVADLCCGIGADLRALASAGCTVTAIDRDPITVDVARANVTALGIENASVECLDVETLGIAQPSGAFQRSFDAAFLDPARRHEGRRTFDVHAYSPGWPFVLALLTSMPAAVKIAPGIPHELIPDGVEAEWVSFGGALKETVLWSGSLAGKGISRRATLLPSGATLTPDGAAPTAGGPCRYLYEPDDAVVRAHLVAELAEAVGGRLLDPTTAYVTSDRLVETPFAHAFEIEHVMPFSLKRLRHELRARSVGTVTIMKRGSAVDVEKLRRELRLSGDRHAVVVLALIEGRHQVLIAHPVTTASRRPTD